MTYIEIYSSKNKIFGSLSNNFKSFTNINGITWTSVSNYIYTEALPSVIDYNKMKKADPENIHSNYLKFKYKAEDDLLSSESENDNKPQNGGAKSDNKYSSKLEDSDSFNKLLEELDEDEEEFEFKNKKKYKNELVLPYFAIPGLIDPISYYWYSNIYYDLPKMIVPSFIPTISPRIVIDLNLP